MRGAEAKPRASRSDPELDSTFSSVVSELHARLCAMAVAITANRSVAEDAVAGAYASTWARFRKGDVTELDRYLWRAVARQARRLCLVHRRPDPSLFPSAPADPADVATAEVELARLLARLPVDQRTVVALRYVAGFSESEVAELLSIPAGTVKSRLARGAGAIRARYEATMLAPGGRSASSTEGRCNA